MRGPISFTPEPDPREEAKAFKPWWRRFVDWLTDAHSIVIKVSVVCGATLGAHAWLKAQVFDATVKKAVADEMLTIKVDLAELKANTGGLPAWRADVSDKISKLEDQTAHNTKDIVRVEGRVDQWLISRGAR
jgi:hypothetical protein